MAFSLAGLMFFCTLSWCALVLFSEGMRSAPDTLHPMQPVLPILIIGTMLSLIIAGTHWLPTEW